MAALSTDIYVGQSSVNVKDRVDGNKVTGDMKTFTAIYTATGLEAVGDVLSIVQLPVGAILNADSLRVTTDGVGGTTATLATIGDAGTAARYSATAVALTAAGTNLTVTGVNANALTPYPVTKDTNVIQATLGLAAGAFTAGKKVLIRGNFRMP
jgi:hypothetical protein